MVTDVEVRGVGGGGRGGGDRWRAFFRRGGRECNKHREKFINLYRPPTPGH